MIHLNDVLSGNKALRFLDSFLPEIYSATTLSDFLKNKEEIKPTRTFLPPGIFFNGSSSITIESSVIYTKINNNSGEISDLTSSIQVMHSPIHSENKFLDKNVRLYKPALLYNISKGTVSLYKFEEKGPPNPEYLKNDVPPQFKSRGLIGARF